MPEANCLLNLLVFLKEPLNTIYDVKSLSVVLSRISTVSVISGCSQQPCVALAEVWARDACRTGTNVVLPGAHVHPIDLVWGANKQAAACAAVFF